MFVCVCGGGGDELVSTDDVSHKNMKVFLLLRSNENNVFSH